ncbi:hypothetical protein AX17_005234 [Amanita inopinata Kibby_2008]|nr:hypothetical protein AX17_005234 [Amanita inopinata Kibby_2008]
MFRAMLGYHFTYIALSPHMFNAPAKYNLCIVSADYRLAPQTRLPGIIEDCRDAIQFIHSAAFVAETKNRVDTAKIALSGSSAGGWLALLNGLGIGYTECGLELPRPKSTAAIAALYPITDMLDPFWTTKQNPVSYMEREIDRKEVEPFVDPADQKTTFSAIDNRRSIFYHYMVQEGLMASLLLDDTNIPPSAFSAAAAVKSGDETLPPIYIVHGNKDGKVPHRQSTDVVEVLKTIGASVEYHEMEGLDHAFDKEETVDMSTMYEFLGRVFN